MKKLIVLTILAIFFIFPSGVKANILINEISPETSEDWVELYNNSTESASLVGYQLTDSAGNTEDLSGNILGNGFLSFSFIGGRTLLNNDGDTVNLVNNSSQIDSMTYGGSGNVCIPSGSETIGRYPDGANFIDKLSSPTRNAANTWDATHACPTPTPAPTQSPTPTQSPSPTQSPVPTKSPSPLPKTPTPTPMGIRDNSATPPADVLGLRNSITTTDPPTPAPGQENSNNFPVIAGVFILAGAALTGLAIYMGIKKQQSFSSGTINK